jgi:hypothetical protein
MKLLIMILALSFSSMIYAEEICSCGSPYLQCSECDTSTGDCKTCVAVPT